MMAELQIADTLPSPCPQSKRSSRQVITIAVVAATIALVYLQWRSWHTFDWGTFAAETRGLEWLPLVGAVILSLLTFPLRAWRWQVFLKPVREASFKDVFAPTLIGFAGLALLGRPGELVRPYMIARRMRLTMASQMGVWTVERIFDMAAFAVMVAVDLLVARDLPDLHQFRTAAWITGGIVLAMAVGAVLVCRAKDRVFAWTERSVVPRFPRAGAIFHRARCFADGLHTIKDGRAFVELSVSSVGIWLLTAFAYVATLHAYPSLRHMSFSGAMLLMGFSMIGGLVQLPAVGGGAQLATIVAMVDILGVPRELAVSAGILLWLVSFHAVTPIGLWMARRSHVSLRRMSENVQEPTATAVPTLCPPKLRAPAHFPVPLEENREAA